MGTLEVKAADKDLPSYVLVCPKKGPAVASGLFDYLPWPKWTEVTTSENTVQVPRGETVLVFASRNRDRIAIEPSPFGTATAPDKVQLTLVLSAVGTIRVDLWTQIVEVVRIEGGSAVRVTGDQLQRIDELPIGTWRVLGRLKGEPFDETVVLEAGDEVIFGYEIETTKGKTGQRSKRAYGKP